MFLIAKVSAGNFQLQIKAYNVKNISLGSWRKPVLHTFIAQKPSQ